MKWEIADDTDKGAKSKVNEDSYMATDDYCIISDGMSGTNAGSLASKTTIDFLTDEFEKQKLWKEPEDENEFKKIVNDTISKVNEKVYTKSQEKEYEGMGATLDLLIKRGNKAFLFHAGDSTVFVLKNNGDWKKITEDDTYVYRLYKRGRISKEMTYTHPMKSQIDNCIGNEKDIEIACLELDLTEIKYILMTTDGISSYLTEEEIENELRSDKNKKEIVAELFRKRKYPKEMAKIYKETSPKHTSKELDEICIDLADKDDATVILIENKQEDKNGTKS